MNVCRDEHRVAQSQTTSVITHKWYNVLIQLYTINKANNRGDFFVIRVPDVTWPVTLHTNASQVKVDLSRKRRQLPSVN